MDEQDPWTLKFNDIWHRLELEGRFDFLEQPITTQEVCRYFWQLALKAMKEEQSDRPGGA